MTEQIRERLKLPIEGDGLAMVILREGHHACGQIYGKLVGVRDSEEFEI
jgi:hypothetical protein